MSTNVILNTQEVQREIYLLYAENKFNNINADG